MDGGKTIIITQDNAEYSNSGTGRMNIWTKILLTIIFLIIVILVTKSGERQRDNYYIP